MKSKFYGKNVKVFDNRYGHGWRRIRSLSLYQILLHRFGQKDSIEFKFSINIYLYSINFLAFI